VTAWPRGQGAPAGVAVARDGGLVVLELPWVDGQERVRLRRIAADGAVTTILRIDQP
jgi:hypothetical protein